MATVSFTWNAPPVAQVNTITPANVLTTNTFSVIINGKSITYETIAGTVADVVAGLLPLLQGSTITEFKEVKWTANGTASISGTAATPGQPFTQTSSAAGGTATLTTVVTTASSGPNDLAAVQNYSTGGLPSGGDDLVIENSSNDIAWNLDALAAIALNSITIRINYTGKIGLPVLSSKSGGYAQYRPQYMQVDCPTVTIGSPSGTTGGVGSSTGSGRIKIDAQANACALTVNGTGSPADSPLEACLFIGTNAANVLTVNKGTVGVAVNAGETAVLASWTCAYIANARSDSWIRFGVGVNLSSATGYESGGTVTVQSDSGVIASPGGVLYVLGSATVAGITNDTGTVYYQSDGALAAYAGAGTLDFSRDSRQRSVGSTLLLYKGAKLLDPQQTINWGTYGFTPVRCRLQDVQVNLGFDVNYLPTY
jgi:hypothetical protein